MNTYKLEDNVPYQAWNPNQNAKSKPKYPLAQMKVNQSFVVPENEILGVRSAIQYHQTMVSTKKKFATRTINGGKSLRVWRLK